MSVTKGKLAKENLTSKLKKEADEEKRLTEMMIPKKHKRLYGKIMYSQKKKQQEVTILAGHVIIIIELELNRVGNLL
jgi:hypothetical protein